MKKTTLALLFLLSVSSWGAPMDDVRILTEDSPPGERLDVSGRVTGPTAELVRELGRRVGVKKELEMLPWLRAYSMALDLPRIVLFETTRTPERENLFQWVGPIKRIQWQFWAKKSSKFKPKTLADVRALGSVVAYLGDSKSDFLAAQGFTKMEQVATSEQAAKMLNVGRVVTWIASDLGMKEIFDQSGLKMDDFEPIFTIDTKYLYVALSKDFTASEVQLWRDEFERMKKEGALTRYYTGTYAPSLIRDLEKPGDPLSK